MDEGEADHGQELRRILRGQGDTGWVRLYGRAASGRVVLARKEGRAGYGPTRETPVCVWSDSVDTAHPGLESDGGPPISQRRGLEEVGCAVAEPGANHPSSSLAPHSCLLPGPGARPHRRLRGPEMGLLSPEDVYMGQEVRNRWESPGRLRVTTRPASHTHWSLCLPNI